MIHQLDNGVFIDAPYEAPHICRPEYAGMPGGMRELYAHLRIIPTSTEADVILIRSHVAYWSGNQTAMRVGIKPSRGHSYRITDTKGQTHAIVKIVDYYDHREGVTGWK